MGKLFVFLLAACLLSGCAEAQHVAGMTGTPSGFFGGIWHGLTMPFSFIGSIFNRSIAIYAANNTGAWYDLGFMIGTGCFIGGGSAASR